MNKLSAYYQTIKAEADTGKVRRYYTFWVILEIVVLAPIITYIYEFAPIPTWLKDIIFISLFVTIGITNYQSIWVVIDVAKRTEPRQDVLNKGTIFMGTIIKSLELNEIKEAQLENRKPLTTEEVSMQFAENLIWFMKSVKPIQKECGEKKITIKGILDMIHKIIQHADDIEKLVKLAPLIVVIAQSVEGLDQKKLGFILGREITRMVKDVDAI